MKRLTTACACLVIMISTGAQAGDPLHNGISLQSDIGRKSAESQQKIDSLFNDRQQLLQAYQKAERELQSLQRYDDHLQRMVTAQERRIESLQQQMAQIDVTHREVLPLISRMMQTLRQFIGLDVPFLLQERRERVDQLEALLDRPDATLAEKYRRVLEAYQVETEYGRTLEAYRGELEPARQERTVDYLRVGRLVLIYRSLDGKELGIWNQRNKSWQPLPDIYRNAVSQGFRVAKKQVAPDLLQLLVPAPESAP
jgi:septal ring factor EnvC (AmiA/AmiB activator)